MNYIYPINHSFHIPRRWYVTPGRSIPMARADLLFCRKLTKQLSRVHSRRHLPRLGSRCSLECVISLLAPGQGSQTPGMLTPWLELPGAHDRIALWSKASGLDLVRLGTTASAEEITDTAVTQPLVVAAALIAFEELESRGLVPADAIAAGHSVGELAAAAIAGVISPDDA